VVTCVFGIGSKFALLSRRRNRVLTVRRSGKMYHKIEAGGGGGAVTNVAWHTQETSKIVTGGLDGNIRLWD